MNERQVQEFPSVEQTQLLKLKLEIIQIWCVFLYNSEHRCLLNHICMNVLSGNELTRASLTQFKNSINILTQLKDGFIINIVDNKAEKTSYVKLNNQFFVLLPKLIEMIKDKISPQLQKIKMFNPQEKKKVCTVCQVEKTESQIRFMGAKCECAYPNFVDVKIDLEKKARYQQLQKLLTIIILKRNQLQKLEISINSIIRQKKEQKQKKLSDYEKFLDKFKINPKEEKQKQKFDKNCQVLMKAYNAYAPKQSFLKVNQLSWIRETRAKRSSMI